MRILLNAGFGEPISETDWAIIRDLCFDGVRQDIPSVMQAAGLVTNLAWSGLPLSIALINARGAVEGTLQIADAVAVSAKAVGMTSRLAVEVGNEEDINGRWGNDPRGYGRLVAQVSDLLELHAHQIRVVSGGISSTGKEALAWLAEAMSYIPARVAVGYHPYRNTPPAIPKSGFKDRDDEFRSLRAIAGDRPIWNTEVGWHTAPRDRKFPLCFLSDRWSDGEVASFFRTEMRINEAAGAEVATIFQFNDSPKDEPEGRFGIRTHGGTLKPQARVAMEMRT